MHSRRTNSVVLPCARARPAVEMVHLPEPGPGEVLLRMEACGICHSDVFVTTLERLPLAPVTLGHEGIGRVEAIGEGVTGWAPRDRAGITFLGTTCGDCEWCGSGRERFCPKQTNFGYTLQGALSDWVIAPVRGLVRVPDGLAAEMAAPLCCAGWTAYGAVREAGVVSGETVALFGFGGLGQLALQIARHKGARVAVADPNEQKMETARAAGADVNPKGVDAAIVFTAAAAAIPQAFRALKRNGRLVLVGLSVASYELPLVDTVLKGITVQGSYLGSPEDLQSVFELAERGVVCPRVEVHAIGDAPELIERLRRGEVSGRAVVKW